MSSAFNGVLLIDKPQGLTSHDVVARVRRLFKTREVGHAGTLDPMATGLLVMLIGEATKLSSVLLEGDKYYSAQVRLGVETDTWDIEGVPLIEKPVDPDIGASVHERLNQFVGIQSFKVPAYSAIKVKGEKLYEKARAQEVFELPVRQMGFLSIENVVYRAPEVSFDLHCTKGSYVRSLAYHLGAELKTGAALSALRRTGSAPFRLEQALTLTALEERASEGELSLECFAGSFFPLERCLPHWPLLRIEGQDERLMSNGQLSYRLENLVIHHYLRAQKGVRVVSRRTGRLVALLHAEAQRVKVLRVFNAQA